MLRLIALTAVVLAGASGTAQAACTAPTAPYCVGLSGAFTDNTEASNCYTEFQAYFEAMKANDTCLNSEIDAFIEQQKRVSDTAWGAYEQALTAYNRRNGT